MNYHPYGRNITITEESDTDNFNNNEMIEYGTNDTNNKDTDSFIKYLHDKLKFYENNINTSYINIKNIISTIEEEFPQIDINNFSEFFLICEDFYKFIQHSKQILNRAEEFNRENEKLKVKIEKTKEKKFNLKNENQNLMDDNNFKEEQLKKMEKELLNLTKEMMEMNMIKSVLELNNEDKRKEVDFHGGLEIQKYINEIKTLTEEKILIQKENSMNLKFIEKLENEIKLKYLPKHETEKIILKLESEKFALNSRLKNSESNLEKLKREIQNLKVGNDELKKELEKSAKKLEELKSHSNNVRFFEENNEGELPLNLIMNEEDEDYQNEQSKRHFYSKLRRNSTRMQIQVNEDTSKQESTVKHDKTLKNDHNTKQDSTSKQVNTQVTKAAANDKKNKSVTVDNIIKEENDNEINSNYINKLNNTSFDNNKTLFKEINQNEFFNTSNCSGDNSKNHNDHMRSFSPDISRSIHKPNFELKITSEDIVSKMSRNEFLNFRSVPISTDNSFVLSQINKQRNSNKKILNVEKTIPSGKLGNELIMQRLNSIKKNPNTNNENMYKEFFMLTYKSLKLNYQSIEPFLYLNAEKLYKSSTDNCVPFHKYYQFIKKEIKECNKKINKNADLKKTKYTTVLNYLSSQLF